MNPTSKASIGALILSLLLTLLAGCGPVDESNHDHGTATFPMAPPTHYVRYSRPASPAAAKPVPARVSAPPRVPVAPRPVIVPHPVVVVP